MPSIDLLACPHCDGSMDLDDAAVLCERGHSFDVARQGYVSLLTGAATPFTGDTADMIAARGDFLDTGYYDPVRGAVASACTTCRRRRLPHPRGRCRNGPVPRHRPRRACPPRGASDWTYPSPRSGASRALTRARVRCSPTCGGSYRCGRGRSPTCCRFSRRATLPRVIAFSRPAASSSWLTPTDGTPARTRVAARGWSASTSTRPSGCRRRCRGCSSASRGSPVRVLRWRCRAEHSRTWREWARRRIT